MLDLTMERSQTVNRLFSRVLSQMLYSMDLVGDPLPSLLSLLSLAAFFSRWTTTLHHPRKNRRWRPSQEMLADEKGIAVISFGKEPVNSGGGTGDGRQRRSMKRPEFVFEQVINSWEDPRGARIVWTIIHLPN